MISRNAIPTIRPIRPVPPTSVKPVASGRRPSESDRRHRGQRARPPYARSHFAGVWSEPAAQQRLDSASCQQRTAHRQRQDEQSEKHERHRADEVRQSPAFRWTPGGNPKRTVGHLQSVGNGDDVLSIACEIASPFFSSSDSTWPLRKTTPSSTLTRGSVNHSVASSTGWSRLRISSSCATGLTSTSVGARGEFSLVGRGQLLHFAGSADRFLRHGRRRQHAAHRSEQHCYQKQVTTASRQSLCRNTLTWNHGVAVSTIALLKTGFACYFNIRFHNTIPFFSTLTTGSSLSVSAHCSLALRGHRESQACAT